MGLQLIDRKGRRQRAIRQAAAMTSRQTSLARPEAALEFGRFRVLLRRRQLLADGMPVELGTRAFDLLVTLLDAGGSLVPKDELMSRVWPGIVVDESNLKVQISALRKALGKDCDVIRTEVGRGYRFTAAIRSTLAAPDTLSAAGEMLAVVEREIGRPPNLSGPDLSGSDPSGPDQSEPGLSAMVSQLARLEAELAKALDLLATHYGREPVRSAR